MSEVIYKKQVYAFIFPDGFVYVGLTCNIKTRRLAHLCPSSKSPVRRHLDIHLKPEFKVLSELLSCADGSELERFYIKDYAERGFTLLNSTAGGDLGGNKRKWTKEPCHKEALKFYDKGSFIQYRPLEYAAALRHGWIDEICSHMYQTPQYEKYWTIEICQEDANNCNSEEEFERKYPLSHAAAKRHGWLESICSHMIEYKNLEPKTICYSYI